MSSAVGMGQPRFLANLRKELWRLRHRPRTRPRLTSHPDISPVLIAYNKFGACCVPTASLHRESCQTVLDGKVWEEETVEFMRANVGDGDIIHAGAYFGDFLPGLSKALAPQRTVFAFEPVLENYRCAFTTLALNNLTNVQLTHAALGASSENLRFATRGSNGRSLGGISHVDSNGNEAVRQVRLDDVIPESRRISILQLDVEEFEENALEGGRRVIEQNRPIIILESVPAGFAESFGYVFDRKLNNNSVLRPR